VSGFVDVTTGFCLYVCTICNLDLLHQNTGCVKDKRNSKTRIVMVNTLY